MKLVTFDCNNGPHPGVLLGDDLLLDLSAASGGAFRSVRTILEKERALQEVKALSVAEDFDPSAQFRLSEVKLRAPILRPGKIVCLGLNYRDHAAESDSEVPGEPVIFCKAPTSVIGPEDEIQLPEASENVDYEVELAFVMGKKAKLVSAKQAMNFVAGYSILCDVSARDYQHEKPGGQWYLGKSFDTFCPLGPWIVTCDEIGDPHNLALSCRVSGEVMQSSSTSQMVFGIPEIIAYLTRVFTLEPGDVVATGTPAGVGAARIPPRFLRDGDTVECEVEGIGKLKVPVRV
ncbi:MAG: fumarylacetoacetate hydrolase family protein [Candidatus Brocadiia bacterium]